MESQRGHRNGAVYLAAIAIGRFSRPSASRIASLLGTHGSRTPSARMNHSGDADRARSNRQYPFAALADSRPPGTRHGRLRSIDVLRGLAALGVVLFHATDGQLFVDRMRSAPWMFVLGLPTSLGFSGVYLFFVISGFCIHLAWARQRAENRTPVVPFVPFWKRRIRRLYPPYLVALGLYLLLLWFQGTGLATTRPVAWDIGLHLVMLHNVDPQTTWSINGVFWTLAIEEQLYLAYFLLLALRKRLGWTATLAVCLAVRVGWFALAFLAHRALGLQVVVTEAAAGALVRLGSRSVERRGLVRSRASTPVDQQRVVVRLVASSRGPTVPWTTLPHSGRSTERSGLAPRAPALGAWLLHRGEPSHGRGTRSPPKPRRHRNRRAYSCAVGSPEHRALLVLDST